MTVNLQWRDAMTKAGREFTRAEHDAGWPQAMKPAQLATLQRPYASDDRMGRAAAVALRSELDAACVAGLIDHTATTTRIQTRPAVQVTPGRFSTGSTWEGGQGGRFNFADGRIGFTRPGEFKDVTERHIIAPTFAAWLTVQGQTPSPHIAAWFALMGAESKAIETARPDETLEERDDRWLAHYEIEVKSELRGAYARGAAHFNVERSKYSKAVNKAKERRAEKYRADIKSVPAKGKQAGWASMLVTNGKKPKTSKA